MNNSVKQPALAKPISTQPVMFYKLKLVRDLGFGRCCEQGPSLVDQLLMAGNGPTITDAVALYRRVCRVFHNLDREHFVIVGLDAKHHIIGGNLVAIGSLSTAIVHPREVFKPVVMMNAAALILLHNHPSGDPTPSPEDHALTKRLRECGELLGIQVLDHLIVGDDRYYSFVDQGVMR